MSHTCCGLQQTDGDSSIIFKEIKHCIENMNSSKNSGILGASLFSSYSSIEYSFLKYSQDSNSTSYISLESESSVFDCNCTNFIHTKGLQSAIILSNPTNIMVLNNCIFYDSHQKLSSEPKYLCTLHNCFSDSQFPNVQTKFPLFEKFHSTYGFNKCNQIKPESITNIENIHSIQAILFVSFSINMK